MKAFPLKMDHKLIISSHLVVFGDQRDGVAELLQAPERPTLGGFEGLLLGMARSQFAIGLVLFEQVIDNDQDAVRQGHNGFLAAHAFLEPLVIRPQVGALAARSPMRRLDEGLTQPAVALARFGTEPLRD